MNFATVCSEIPSILTPSLLTNLANFLSCFAGHLWLVQCRVLVLLAGLVITSVGEPQTGHLSGICSKPTFLSTLMTFGIILLAFITLIREPFSPIFNRSHSLILHSDARFTVVPSKVTG